MRRVDDDKTVVQKYFVFELRRLAGGYEESAHAVRMLLRRSIAIPQHGRIGIALKEAIEASVRADDHRRVHRPGEDSERRRRRRIGNRIGR